MNLSTTWSGWREPARTNFHGVLMSVVVAVAAISLAERNDVSRGPRDRIHLLQQVMP